MFTRMTAHDATERAADAGMQRLFNRIAPEWDRIRADPIYRDAFVDGLDLLESHAQEGPQWTNVLDLACGTGLATQVLVDRYPTASITGIDIADEMVTRAAVQVPDAEFVVGSSGSLPFDDDTFDLITSLDGIHDIGEIARVTASGGAALIVYSRGADIPVSRHPGELLQLFATTDMPATLLEDGDRWIIGAVRA